MIERKKKEVTQFIEYNEYICDKCDTVCEFPWAEIKWKEEKIHLCSNCVGVLCNNIKGINGTQ